MTTITKAQTVSTIYQEFYNLIDDNIPDPQTPDRSKWIFPCTPEQILPTVDSKTISSVLPIIILNSPNIKWDDFTFTSKKVSGTIEIEYYDDSSKDVDNYADLIINTIETKRGTMRTDGLRFVNLESVDSSDDVRGELTIHCRSITFSFQFLFDKTQTW